MGLAQTLLLQNSVVGRANLIAFLVCYLVRVPRGEATMLDHLGNGIALTGLRPAE